MTETGDVGIGMAHAAPPAADAFAFGPFELVPGRNLLLRSGRPVRLGGRAFDLLHLLVSRAGELVSKGDLIGFAWPGVLVDERNLKVHVRSLRVVLEDTGPQAAYIVTVVRRGYRFVAEVRREPVGTTPVPTGGATTSSSPPDVMPTGRRGSVERLAGAVEAASIVTLARLGAGGRAGFAVALARLERRRYPDGVFLVDLSALEDAELVPRVVAEALGIPGEIAGTLDGIVEQLRHRRALVVLVDCERVLLGAAALAERLIRAGVACSLLANTRKLSLDGEDPRRDVGRTCLTPVIAPTAL